MKASVFPQWKGFEFSPRGCLLDQFVDLNHEFGFAYERSCEYYKDFHTHDRLMLVCPRGSSSMDVNTKNPSNKFSVDAAGILVIPKDLVHDDHGTSAIYDTLALYPSQKQIELAGEKLALPKSQIRDFLTTCRNIKRTKRIEHLLQEYFFERVLKKNPGEDSDYLARKILHETLLAAFPQTQIKRNAEHSENQEPVLQRAIKFIEANLFEDYETAEIATRIGTSSSTLLRRFKAEVKMTPYAYVKKRRLEEALRLLEAGQHLVGEVALLVGYDNFGAFSDAFKAAYGKSPSTFKRGKGA